MATKFNTGIFYVSAPIADGSNTVRILPMPEGIDDIQVITLGASTATGTVEQTYSSAAEIQAATAVWVALPQTHTIANGVVVSKLADSAGFQVTPTAIRVTRSGGTIFLRMSGKKRY